jgi:hypothetical protein
MNSTLNVLKRWVAMDAALNERGLNVPRFARKWKVSTRTVRRDLKAFKQLGQGMRCVHPRSEEVRDYLWKYEVETDPLFVCNVPGVGG